MPRAATKPTTRYQQGYELGWNHRAQGRRKLRANTKRLAGAFGVGYAHGWHDGEGRGQTWTQHQSDPRPPQPKSWETYEKEGLNLPC